MPSGPFAARLAMVVHLLLPAAAGAQEAGEPVVPEKIGKDLHAFHITGTAPRIDGRSDDEVWTVAEIRDDFVQNEPDNMAAPRERTAIQVAYDDRALYVFVHCFMNDVTQITTGLGRRDTLPPSDLLRMSFDPRHDHQNAYVFETNPSGMLSDYLFYDDTRQSPDYDAVWDVKTTITNEGWTAEYSIPFSQMRFTVSAERMVWGFNLRRDIYRTGEFDRWIATPRGAAGFVSRFGHLIFDARLEPPRRVELLPVTLARLEKSPTTAPDAGVAGGADLRLGLGTAATLSATINPDFAQVEQDPSVLNLSVFETFYPEKRPFFLEDSRLFVPNFPQMLLFHSRRIGHAPGRMTLASTDTVVEKPEATTIVAAAKLTGKASAWSYGAIGALTSAEIATVDAKETDARGEEIVRRVARRLEPTSTFSVVRALRDFKGGTSNVGGMMTAVTREGDTNAYSGGIDHTLRWDRNRGSWTGIWAGTHAAAADQTPRAGFAGLSNFSYGRKHTAVNAHFDRISPHFRNSDIGFLATRVDKTNVNGGFNLMQPDPWKMFRSLNTWAYTSRSWNDSGLVFERRVGHGVDISLKNFSGGYFEWSRDFERLDDLDSRGEFAIVKPAMWNMFGGLRTDSRKTWQAFFNFGASRNGFGGSSYRVSPSFRLPAIPRLQAQISGQYEWGRDDAQWIKNTDVTGDAVDDSVYGTLKRNVVSITGRGTFAFSRDLTIEAYLQPFVAVGDYTDVRRLSRDRSYEFEPASLTSDPDFNDKTLRANLVFRWEYLKGSTLFVVWNRATEDQTRPGVFAAGRDLGGAFSGPATDVVMVKLNYWLGL